MQCSVKLQDGCNGEKKLVRAVHCSRRSQIRHRVLPLTSTKLCGRGDALFASTNQRTLLLALLGSKLVALIDNYLFGLATCLSLFSFPLCLARQLRY